MMKSDTADTPASGEIRIFRKTVLFGSNVIQDFFFHFHKIHIRVGVSLYLNSVLNPE